jgi:hypothetical protein
MPSDRVRCSGSEGSMPVVTLTIGMLPPSRARARAYREEQTSTMGADGLTKNEGRARGVPA